MPKKAVDPTREALPPLGSKTLRISVTLLGSISSLLGVTVALTGTTLTGSQENLTIITESYYRYFATYYAGVGALFLMVAYRWSKGDRQLLSTLLAVLFAAGLSRIICGLEWSSFPAYITTATCFELTLSGALYFRLHLHRDS
ncbi:DUF4345 family protein [Streptomyces sp. NPDC056069]|uniref:DUF4345 family protein n=1 Tax=Streptomyces sp. NPDC056069 TaxID=3345702 RepID=UPI0035DA84D1